MIDLSLANVAIYSAQLLGVVLAAAAGAWLLQVPPPRFRYWYWRTVIATCLTLPLIGLLRPPAANSASLPIAAVSDAVEAVGRSSGDPSSMTSFGPVLIWALAIGVAFRVLRLAIGLLRLRRLRRQSLPIVLDEDIEVLRRGLAFDAAIKTHPLVQQPITFGFRRPIVLLPESLVRLSTETQRVVACHELLHVQRRDWLWTLGEEVLRALFWFHPAMRWALNRVRLTREELVDARVVELTGARRAYMNALLTFANNGPALSPATLFGRRSQLAARIRRIAEEVHMSRLRLALTSAGLVSVLTASTWGLTAAMPLRVEQIGGDQSIATSGQDIRITLAGANLRMPITRIQPEYPVDLMRSGVGATITLIMKVSERGHVEDILEPKWQVTLSQASTIDDVPGFWARKPWLQFVEAAQSAVRQWTFEPGEPITTEVTIVFRRGGDVTMFAPAPPPPPPPPPPPGDRGSIDQARERLQRARALLEKAEAQKSQGLISVPGSATPGQAPRAGAPPPPPPPPPPSTQGDVLRVGGAINAPQKIKDVRPVYPAAAQEAGIEGVVLIEVQIAEDGTVAAAHIVRSISLLDDAALDAVRQWIFTPTLLNGVPISVAMMVTVNFTLAR